MDLSSSVGKVFCTLFRPKVEDLRVYTHRPDSSSRAHWIVTCYFSYQGVERSAGAVGSSYSEALIKTLSEAGEAILALEEGKLARCGFAGGFFQKTAIERAKCEALERDAFCFHYRNDIPFLKEWKIEGQNELIAYQMETRDNSKFAVFLTDVAGSTGAYDCLKFGASCSLSLEGAVKKALAEYAGFYFNHRFGNARCQENFKALESLSDVFERHHVSTIDERNRCRIRSICSIHGYQPKRSRLADNGWFRKSLKSPIKGLEFVYLEHPDLEALEFGTPESWTSSSPPLYHPYY